VIVSTGASPAVSVGIRVPHELFEGGARKLRVHVESIAAAGIDRVCVGDHVSFHGGRGFDGLVQATALAALCDLQIQTAIYLLPLRHPVPVARQVNSLAQLADGGFVFGVGVGGEDPAEVRMCGVDPSTRGRRMDESLALVRALLEGDVVERRGEFFDVSNARILPLPPRPVPVVVGGRSDAALRRAGLLGDGYLAVWVDAARFAASTERVEVVAAAAGRTGVAWQHGMQVWCGFGESSEQGRSLVRGAMEELYRVPFERFERHVPYGTPSDVAVALRPFVEAGCRHVNLIPVAATSDEAVRSVAEVRRLLLGTPAR
jgi:alkanesulfonate monooxygenase SsuD/methylene tetrahydromethanopterin reductase-like flavin-dependent oxidoreductase (luciferase family)